MLLFKSILDGDFSPGPGHEKRKLARYPIGESFPFRTKLTLQQTVNGKAVEGKMKDWSVTPLDLSLSGASLELSLAAVAFQRDQCRVKFSKGDYLLEIPGTIAHFRCGAQSSRCGVLFNFATPELQQAYRQMLEPVVIGNSLTPIPAVQDEPGRHKEAYGATPAANLIVWRDAPGGNITGFDLTIHCYVVRWSAGLPELEVYGLTVAEGQDPAATPTVPVALDQTQHEEVSWLFCLAVPNLPAAMPADLRSFFGTLVG